MPLVNSLNNQELKQYYDLKLEIYNSSTGFPIKDVNSGSHTLLQDSKGRLWAATGSDATALVCMQLNAVNRAPAPPKPLIQKLKINEQNICYYNLYTLTPDSATLAFNELAAYGKILNQTERDSIGKQYTGITFDGITKFYSLPQKLVLPYKFRNFSFEFNAMELSKPYLVNYQYMLEGYDEDWSPVLKKTEAVYSNISEGKYTFKVRAQYTGPAAEGGNEWSEATVFAFKVLPPLWRTWWAYTLYALALVGVVYFLMQWNSRKLKARAVLLTQKVNEATLEIKEQKEQVEEQKQHLEEKHKEITDSINYAERIQRSFMATKETLDTNLENYFIFFKPKDVVSGDFYWAETLQNSNFALATSDSTGHGVPGAIMSLLNISGLEKAIEKSNEPSIILNETRKTIINRLKRDGSAEGGKDGMDCSLCVYDFKNLKLYVACANNPVWIVRSTEVIEIKPDKMPVGKHDKQDLPFTQHEVQLQKGDVVYTLTDGFPDQFGGETGKKFLTKNLRELLAANTHLPMQEQKQFLEKTFSNWAGTLEQVDDVTIIGVRV